MFLELNGVPGIPVPVDDAENLVVDVAAGRLDEVAGIIATALRTLYESAAAWAYGRLSINSATERRRPV